MDQIEISLPIEKEFFLKAFSRHLCERHKFSKSALKLQNIGSRSTMKVGICSKNDSILLHLALSEYVAYVIKQSYYSKLIHFPEAEKTFSFVLLKALVFADFDECRDAVFSRIKRFSTICLDGVENFLISDLKEEWKQISILINENLFRISDRDMFIEFLKCITSSILSRFEQLSIIGGNEPVLVDEALNQVPFGFAAFERLPPDFSLLAALIEHYPKHLKLYGNTDFGCLSDGIGVIFEGKSSNQRKNMISK